MPGDLQPLSQNFPIVDQNGNPNLYFIKWAQQRQIDITAGITAAQAQALIDDWAAARDVFAGAGLDGGGNLSGDITIDANASAILDLLSNTQGTVLYRGAATWAGLAPGTSGHFLKTNGAGANPAWAAASGGSAAWTLISTTTISSPVATVDLINLSTYNDLSIICRLLTASSSGNRQVLASIDNGSTFYSTSGDYVTLASTGTESATVAGFSHSTATTSARTVGGIIDGANINGDPKWFRSLLTADSDRLFVVSTSPINALRVQNSAGNLTGGTIYLLGR